jgi:hypothetical protein
LKGQGNKASLGD